MTKTLKNLTAVSISAVLFVLSPGLPAYQAFAQTVARPVPAGMSMPATPVVVGVLPGSQSALPQGQTLQGSALPTLNALPSVRVQVPAAVRTAAPSAAVRAAAPFARPVAAQAAQTAAATGRTAAVKEVSRISVGVAETLKGAGDLSAASAETSRGVGSKVQALLTGVRFNAAEDLPFEPAVEIGGVHRGFELAKPAGQELAETVGAFRVQADVPAPVEEEPAPQPPSRQSPTWPKFLAAGLALLPAALIGWPMLMAGIASGALATTVLGGATLASSVLLAALPFMGANTSKGVRMIPGIGLTALGLAAAYGAFTLGTGYAAAALVALGGWGLVRYGKSEDSRRGYDNEYALSAFFGALGATALPALALMPYTGIVATVLLVGSYLTSALLLMHLPSWVGYGIESVMRTLYYGTRGIARVEDSLRNDTVLYDRLLKFTKAQLDRSPWNAVWLAGIWIPVWLSELVQWALSIAVGVAVGVMQAPVVFAWGASHKLAGESRVTVFFAEWARAMFDNVQGGKKALYNPLIQRLLPFVNSKNKFVSLPASLGLRLAQWGWALYALIGTPVLGLVGFVRAFGRSAVPYEGMRHNPRYLKADTDDRAGDNTDEPGPGDPSKPGKSALAPRIIATTLALLPAGFFGVPMLLTMSPAFGGLYLALTLALAALPFLPAATPKKLRQLPGVLLSVMGAASLAGLYMLFVAQPITAIAAPALLAAAPGLLASNGFWMGTLGLVGGWGLYRYLGRIANEDGKRISPDDPEYIGAFFGATAAAAGLGAVLMGLSGWPLVVLSALAYLTSPLLLMHLPRWVFRGFGSVLFGIGDSARGFYRILNVWERETDFHRNLRRHANYWLGKTVWNGAWLSVIWVPMWLTQLAEFVLAGVLGLAMGVVRAPFNYAAGAIHEALPDSKLDRFFQAFTENWLEQGEGRLSYEQFKRSNRRWLEGMNSSAQTSHRPTLGAVLSGLAVRLDQAVWLIGTALATPVLMAYGAYKGFKAAFAKPDGGTPSAPADDAQSSASSAPQTPASNSQAGKATLRGIVFTGALGAVSAGVLMMLSGAHVALGAALLVAGSIAGAMSLVAGRPNSKGEEGVALGMIAVFAAALAAVAAVLAVPVHYFLGLSWRTSVGVVWVALAVAESIRYYLWDRKQKTDSPRTVAEGEVGPQSSASSAPQTPASNSQAGKATLRGIVFTGALGAVSAGLPALGRAAAAFGLGLGALSAAFGYGLGALIAANKYGNYEDPRVLRVASALAVALGLVGFLGGLALGGVSLLAAAQALLATKAAVAVLGALIGLGLTALVHLSGGFKDDLHGPSRMELALAYGAAIVGSALVAVALLMAL